MCRLRHFLRQFFLVCPSASNPEPFTPHSIALSVSAKWMPHLHVIIPALQVFKSGTAACTAFDLPLRECAFFSTSHIAQLSCKIRVPLGTPGLQQPVPPF